MRTWTIRSPNFGHYKLRPRGFTLIELLFVVAIISILAAVALPAYQTYVYRARITEVLNFLDFTRKNVTDFYGRRGYFPTDNAQAGLPAPEQLKGHYLRSLEVHEGALYAELNLKEKEQDQPMLRVLTMRPAINRQHPSVVIWICGTRDLGDLYPDFTLVGSVQSPAVEETYLPAVCRKNSQ